MGTGEISATEDVHFGPACDYIGLAAIASVYDETAYPSTHKTKCLGSIWVYASADRTSAFSTPLLANVAVLLFILFCGTFWANLPLIKFRRPISAVVLSLVLVPIFELPASIGSRLLSRTVEARAYKVQGFKMVNGCNGGAANGAAGDIHTIEQELEWLSEESPVNTNMIAQLYSIQAMAKEKARVLRDDCAKRGHRENYPWKTNWVMIRPIIKAAQEETFK